LTGRIVSEQTVLYDGLTMQKVMTVERRMDQVEKFHRTKEYYYAGLNVIQVKEMLAAHNFVDTRSMNTTFLYQDIGGSVVLATNVSEGSSSRFGRLNYVEQFRYDVYGRLLAGNPDASHGVCFSGKDLDIDSGMLYFGFRHYSPDRKRWNTVDPIRDGTNWYLYCAADPVNHIDPWGLCPDSSIDKSKTPEDYVPDTELGGDLGKAYESLAGAEAVALGVTLAVAGGAALTTGTLAGVLGGICFVGMSVAPVAVGLDLLSGNGLDITHDIINKVTSSGYDQ
jgi:RHS repeat-associated protein